MVTKAVLGKKQLGQSSKYLLLCYTEESKSYRFRMTYGRHVWVTYPFKSCGNFNLTGIKDFLPIRRSFVGNFIWYPLDCEQLLFYLSLPFPLFSSSASLLIQ